MSMTPGELRPAFRDPTPNEALRRAYREEAHIPLSQRQPLPPEPLPLSLPAWQPPESYDAGAKEQARLKALLTDVQTAIREERAKDFPDAAFLKRRAAEQAEIQERAYLLKQWLNEELVRNPRSVMRFQKANPETAAKLLANIEDGGASLVARLYGMLHARQHAAGTITNEEAHIMGEASHFLRKQHGILVGDLFPSGDLTRVSSPPAPAAGEGEAQP